MLGLGRALGETMAVAMVLSASGIVTFNLISSDNPSTIAANIALMFPEATGLGVNALIATGLVLFVITFAVNFAARAIVARSRERGTDDRRQATADHPPRPETGPAARRTADLRRHIPLPMPGSRVGARAGRGRSPAPRRGSSR